MKSKQKLSIISGQPNHDPFHQCIQVLLSKRWGIRSLERWLYIFHFAEASTIPRSIASYIVGDLRPQFLLRAHGKDSGFKNSISCQYSFHFNPKCILTFWDNILWYYCNMLATYCNISRYAFGIS